MPARSPLNVAVVGAGRMGLHHARIIQRIPGLARLVAIVEPDAKSRAEACEVFPDVEVHEALGPLLGEAGRLDVVHICTPPATHVEVALTALEAGCHVYVEKPVATRRADALRLLETAKQRGLLVGAGHQLLFEKPMQRLRDLHSAVGRVVHVESYFAFRPVRRSLRADLQLEDILPHPVYLLLAGLGEAQDVGDDDARLASVEIGPGGTVHALVRRNGVTGCLTVTLDGRPVESTLRVVGTRGELLADFVRGTVRDRLHAGTSAVDKVLDPYRTAWRSVQDTTASLARRTLTRSAAYPGLEPAFTAFYESIIERRPAPISPSMILDTVSICEAVMRRVRQAPGASRGAPAPASQPRVAVTGGTGFLGRAVVQELSRRGYQALVLARRQPAPWERLTIANYVSVDLGAGCDPELLRGCHAVIHCAAETRGGWADHERNTLAAAEQVFLAAAAAGVRRFLHVSSMAALASGRSPLSESSALESGRGRGPYAWGKAESERRLVRLAGRLDVALRIVRPGAIIDTADFEPPGRLGLRIGNLFVAPGRGSDLMGVVDLRFAASIIAWMIDEFDDAPRTLNLLDPQQPTRRELLARLRRWNPSTTVIRVPAPLFVPLSWLAAAAQAMLRPGRPAVRLHRVFAAQRYDLGLIEAVAQRLSESPVEPHLVDSGVGAYRSQASSRTPATSALLH